MTITRGVMPAPAARQFPMKYLVFTAIAAMTAYVLYHNERFLIDPAHPIWNHYEPFKWWLLPHGLAGACALLLAPLQFAEGLRRRHTTLHRTIGTFYIIGVFILGPLGLYIQYLDEAQGAARSFTVETIIQSSTLMITTAIGLYFALKRQFTYHRQWIVYRDTRHPGRFRSGRPVRLAHPRDGGLELRRRLGPDRRHRQPAV